MCYLQVPLCRAWLCLHLGHRQECITTCKHLQAIAADPSVNDTHVLVETKMLQASALAQEGEPEQAIALLTKAQEQCEQESHFDIGARCRNAATLASVYQRLAMHREACKYYTLAAQLLRADCDTRGLAQVQQHAYLHNMYFADIRMLCALHAAQCRAMMQADASKELQLATLGDASRLAQKFWPQVHPHVYATLFSLRGYVGASKEDLLRAARVEILDGWHDRELLKFCFFSIAKQHFAGM